MNQKNNFGLIWSYILKVMNFLSFKDFSKNFPIFYEFILDLFRILKNKKIVVLYCVLMWQLTQQGNDMSPCGDVCRCLVATYVCAFVGAHVCACVRTCACACTSVISVKHPF